MARPKKTKTRKIIEMLEEGKSVAQIYKAVKVSPSYVYHIRAKKTGENQQDFPLLEQKAPPPAEAPPLTLWQRVCSFLYFWR
jgi:transposase-like protein